MKTILLLLICVASTFISLVQTKNQFYIVDGKPIFQGLLKTLATQDIKGLAVVLNDKNAQEKYGVFGSENGVVIEITTKDKIILYSYRELLESFHFSSSDTTLPTLVDVYFIKDINRYY